MKIIEWFLGLISGQPHFYVGGRERPYMLRWYVIPRNPWMNLYLHKFCRDDDDRALHDHPWWFVSVMLWGCYAETLFGHAPRLRMAGSIAFRRATDRHRVMLAKDEQTGRPIPCWTIVLTGRKVREWGFWCPKGFVVWTDFVDRSDKGAIGKGCGD